MYACVCVYRWVCFLMCTVSGWLCVRGQSGGTVPLHLGDSFYLPGTLTGETTSSCLFLSLTHTHTHWNNPLYTSAFAHMCLSFAYAFMSPPMSVCVYLCEYLWLHSLRSSLEYSSHGGNATLSLSLSYALSLSPGAHLCWLPVASCTANVKSCHFAQMHK